MKTQNNNTQGIQVILDIKTNELYVNDTNITNYIYNTISKTKTDIFYNDIENDRYIIISIDKTNKKLKPEIYNQVSKNEEIKRFKSYFGVFETPLESVIYSMLEQSMLNELN